MVGRRHPGGKIMIEFEEMVISESTLEEFSKSFSATLKALPIEMRRRLGDIFKEYFTNGFEYVFERMNQRTVAQVFSEYQPVQRELVDSGEVDGMRFRLYKAPESQD